MKILHVISGYLPDDTGGTQILLRDLCRVQRDRGHSVQIFTRTGGSDHRQLELSRTQWDGVPIVQITNNFSDVDRFEMLYTHPGIDRQFEHVLRQDPPELVHVHHLTCLSTTMVDVARGLGIPVVLDLTDYWMMCPRGQRIRPDDLEICETLDRDRCVRCLQPLWPHLLPSSGPQSLWNRWRFHTPARALLDVWERHMLRIVRDCQALTMLSAFHRDRFVLWGAPADRTFVAEPGVLRETSAPPATRDARRHVGFVGSVIPSKGAHVLCDAFNRMGHPGLVLDIHGEIPGFHGDTTYGSRLRQMVKTDLDVRFHGKYAREDLPGILDGLDVLVVPALWWESYCLTVREGALAGLPVITSRLGGIGDALDQGIAIEFPRGDATALAEALQRVLDAPPDREVIRARADQAVATVEQATDRIDAIYQVALGRASAAAIGVQ
jgi:glycosyltransferase involved in cell wall biosynthesis